MTVTMLHTDETKTCPIVDEPGDYHFEMRCEDCDVAQLVRLNLGQVEDRYHVGRITQDEFEAYMYVWATLSPSGSRPEWRTAPERPDVRRITRKLLRAKGRVLPAELAEFGPWRPACNGASKRPYFVIRETYGGANSEYHLGANGYLVRYGSYEAAKRAADRLNKPVAVTAGV